MSASNLLGDWTLSSTNGSASTGTLSFDSSTYSYNDSSCSDSGAWNLSGNSVTITPQSVSGNGCTVQAGYSYTWNASMSGTSLTMSNADGSTTMVFAKAAIDSRLVGTWEIHYYDWELSCLEFCNYVHIDADGGQVVIGQYGSMTFPSVNVLDFGNTTLLPYGSTAGEYGVITDGSNNQYYILYDATNGQPHMYTLDGGDYLDIYLYKK